MKIRSVFLPVVAMLSLVLVLCGVKDPPNNVVLPDSPVVGYWIGAMERFDIINFKGAQIFVDIRKTDSGFTLVTLDSTRKTPSPIKDTTLVLTGLWRLNEKKDSILLVCDTGRVIDTAKNILKPVSVRGQIIPLVINITQNVATQEISWEVSLKDLVMLAPLLGINIAGRESLLAAIIIKLVKAR